VPEQQRPDDADLLDRLRAGDEAAFVALVRSLDGRLRALARTFTSSPALAEDIVQETWLAVVRGLRGFQGRSSLRTWIFGILVRRARTLAAREARRAAREEAPSGEPGEDIAGEWVPGAGRVGLWEGRPAPWGAVDPAALVQSREALHVIANVLEAMPESQRRVLILRDMEDVPPEDICNILEVSGTNLRVLLHRARARVRRALDAYLRDGEVPSSRGAPKPLPAAEENA